MPTLPSPPALTRGNTVATLNIRNLPDAVHASLRLRAARAGRSMEAEAREILAQACRPVPDGDDLSALQGLVDSLYGADKPPHVVEDLIADRRREAQGE
jgi:plasmid stability protein